jgi:putative transposase
MTYWQLYYHLIWATKQRLPVIDDRMEEILARAIPGIAREDGALSHAIGVMPDHVHVAISIPPKHSVAAVVNRIKGSQ